MDESHDDKDIPEVVSGYMRCVDCNRLILEVFGLQTKHRCIQCWKDRHPLATMEVINNSVRFSARSIYRQAASRKPKVSKTNHRDTKARYEAWRRLERLFPDVFAMLHDEERVLRGLAPIAHYDTLDFEEVAAKTLGFEAVYDALQSRGVSDA